jgi:protein-disulfide isomerase
MRLKPLRSVSTVALLVLSFAAVPALAQRSAPVDTGDTFKDTSFFHPPAGEKIAVIEFQDLECPACANAFPVVHGAIAHYGIPLYEKDFPLRQHIWSFDAAVWARFLQDKVSPKTADDYRGAVFAAQAGIASKDDMLAFTRRFFQSHRLQMPFVPDPTGVLTKEVVAERTLGEKIGLSHTPTIIVCTQHEWVQVTNTQYLYQTIDELLAKVGGNAAKGSAVKHTTPTKKATH